MRAPSEVILVALGGALGAAARYELLQAFPVHPGRFPLTTGAINVGGAFLLGLLLAWLAGHRTVEHWSRWLVGVGGLGAFTTFSAFAVELALLARDGHVGLPAGYPVAVAGARAGAGLRGGGGGLRRRRPGPGRRVRRRRPRGHRRALTRPAPRRRDGRQTAGGPTRGGPDGCARRRTGGGARRARLRAVLRRDPRR